MKILNIGINGAGRIGRLIIRLLCHHPRLRIVCINDLMDIETMKYLIKYDSIHQQFKCNIEVLGSNLIIDGNKIPYEQHSSPVDIPWKKYKTDIVIDASGEFTTYQQLSDHLVAGASKVILGCPSSDMLIPNVIVGINEHIISEEDLIISNASCTANGAAPMLDVMMNAFGIQNAFITTVHPFTNNQRIMDAPHPSPRRSRSLANNIIPTHSTAIKALHRIFPELENKLDGNAIRVPIPAGALIEMMIHTEKEVTVETVNDVFLESSLGYLRHILHYTDEEIVSSDIINNPASCVFDSLLTKVINKKYCYIAGWYDNEYGYANRVIDLVEKNL